MANRETALGKAIQEISRLQLRLATAVGATRTYADRTFGSCPEEGARGALGTDDMPDGSIPAVVHGIDALHGQMSELEVQIARFEFLA